MVVLGAAPEGHFATEHGHRFDIDWERGQKTGFFIDQRKTEPPRVTASGKKVRMYSATPADSASMP